MDDAVAIGRQSSGLLEIVSKKIGKLDPGMVPLTLMQQELPRHCPGS